MRTKTLCILIFLAVPIFSIVLMVPTFDLQNPPVDVFRYDHGEGIEITVVFSDEDHPNPVVDFLYDIYRFFKWGRIQDIETFFVEGSTVVFPDDYASVTSFWQTENLHTPAELPIDDFEFDSGEMIVYINTWNHMFSNTPLPGVPYVEIHVKPREGTRETAEKVYSIFH